MKSSPLRDVAGLLRSLDYAAWSAQMSRAEIAGDPEADAARVEAWRRYATESFVENYLEVMEGSPAHPEDAGFARALLDLFLVQKAVYEVGYELSSRPAWVRIPLSGLLAIAGD